MKPEDFEYSLPPELIAQEPLARRTGSRMMVVNRKDGSVNHRMFTDLPQYLNEKDLLVFNDTRVIPARLLGHKEDTGGSVEVLLLHQRSDSQWECMVRPGRRIQPGHRLILANGLLKAVVVDRTPDSNRIIRFEEEDFWEKLETGGITPLPPYIRRELENPHRYQTVFAREKGSTAAPTAALHFDGDFLKTLEDSGINKVHVTLHIGPGTFRPVKAEKLEDHRMHREFYRIGKDTVSKIQETRKNGGRIIPVGTTSARVLETVFDKNLDAASREGWTDIFIYPGYVFKAVDAILTNFHLPRSTLLMMISALAGRELVLKAYGEAVERGYRFFSFGDCMLIL